MNKNFNHAESIEIKEAPVHRKKSGTVKKFTALLLSVTFGFTGLGLGLGLSNSFKKLMNIADISTTVYAQSADLQFTNSLMEVSPQSVKEIYKKLESSVVSINCQTEVQTRNFFSMLPESYLSPSAGSGIIFAQDDENIYIVTNNHVIENASSVTISLDDENEAPAHYVGSDYMADIAVISVEKSDLEEAGIIDYTVAVFGDSSTLEIGEPAVAIGNALGEGKSATLGIISGLNKMVPVDSQRTLDVIQTDAAINPGNSGGPLVNSYGEVIGINSVKIKQVGVEGIGYSIPSNTIVPIIEDMLLHGMEPSPYLGIGGQTITEDYRDRYNFPSVGAYVQNVISGGSAAAGGIKSGDLIVGYNEIAIETWEDLADAVQNTKIGDVVKLYIFRNRVPMTVEIEIKNKNATADF